MQIERGHTYKPRIRRLEDRVLLNATPEAAVVDLPAEELINDDFTFAVTFDNTALPSDPLGTGYGPFVDVTVEPGVEIHNVTYLGTSVTSQTVGTWNGSNWVDGGGNVVSAHPFGGGMALPQGTEIGQTWINVLAPFGSYRPDQPVIRLDFNATLEQSPNGVDPGAVPGDPIDITARGGFRYGVDELNNPSTDPPIQQGSTSTDAITPIVMRLEKAVQLPEAETAQGPNFPFTYTISIDVATNITVTNVNVHDLLPTNLFFLNATTNAAATSVVAPGVGGTPQGVPGADTVTTAEWSFATVTGRAGGGDIVVTLSAYAPERDASGALIINPLNPHVAIATNDATVDALYQGVPVDAATGGDLEDGIDIAIRPFTVLKTVSVEGGGPPIPGSYLRFQISVDISDYQAFQSAILNDLLSDGLTFDTTDNGTLEHTPVLQLVQNGQTIFIDLKRVVPPSQQSEVTAAFQANGAESLTFFVSNALRNHGYDDRLLGDLFAGDAQQGATTMTLIYFARIDETFRAAGRGPVVVNDVLSNSVSMSANSALPGGGAADTDGSQSSVTVPQPQPQKTVYAVNGVVGNPGTVSPGDLVTYRIRIVLASSDVNDLIITDYLPLPVYDVDANGTGFVFTDTQGGVPAAFMIIRGPDDTLSGGGRIAGIPVVTTLGVNNAIQLLFANFDETASRGGIIDLLYTVAATDKPFADGLLLVNEAVVQTGDSETAVVLEQDFVNQIILRQPVLSLTKGVVATNANGAVDNSLAFNPSTTGPSKLTFLLGTPGFSTSSPLTSADLAANPIVSDLSGIDAGDTVKFAIVIQNTGGQDAFDLLIRDQLPPGFTIPPGAALQLDVRYGDGTAVASFSGDLFGAGLSITDGNGIGSIAADGTNNGRNIIIITYQLVAIDSIDPGITVHNAAELVSYAAIEGGTDFTLNVEGQFDDAVALTTQGVAASKRLVTTDQAFTSGNDFAIGEIGTFQIAVTFPDGDTAATVTDTLPAGMVLVGTPILRLTYINAAGQTVTFDGIVAQNGTPLANGALLTSSYVNNVLTFDFSNVVANAAPGTTLSGQSFVIEYQVRASDHPALQAGVTVSNSVVLDTPTTAPTAPAVVPVDIVEPNLSIIKEFLPDVAQGGQLIQMRLTVQNSSASSSTTSFGLQMTDDDLPLSWFTSLVLTSKTGTGAVNTGLVDVTISQAGGLWVISIADNDPNFAIAPGEKLILNFAMRVDPAIVTGSTLNNVAVIPDGGYTSLPGNDPNERAFEEVTGQDTLTILAPQITKTLVNTSYGGTEYLTPGQTGYVADTHPNVLVGEILIYEIRVPIPRGTSQNVVVYDDTDFLNALGSRGIIEILKVDSYSVGGDLQLSIAPEIHLEDPDGDGVVNRLRFVFGTIVNNATGAVGDEETIVIVVRAQVLNVPETDEGDVHLNGTAVTFSVGDDPNFAVPETNVTVTVTEPAIDVVKSVATPDSTTDAGDVVTFTLTIRHNATSTADGFELNLVDQLPPGTILVANSVTIRAGTPAFGLDPLQLSDVTLDLVNNRVLISGFDLGLNQVVTITYQATVAPNVVSGQTLTNTVDLTYKSLPDVDAVDNEDPSLAKDVPGAESQRRDGTDGGPRTDEALLNNYAFRTTATVTIAQPGPVVKTSDRTSYTIGEQIVYTITIPVIEGLTENPFLTDFLPSGFVYVPGSGIAVDANGNALVLDDAGSTTTNGQQTLFLDLANFTTTADNNPNNDFIRVSFRVQVLNVLDNVNDAVKVNTATFTSDHSPDRTDTVDVRIVEPKLVISKTNNAPGPVDAGDIVTYSISVAHSASSKATAYEFAFRDPIPAGQRVVGIVSARINGIDVSGQIGFDATGIFSLGGANLDIPLGSVLSVVYRVEVLDSVGPGQVLTNTVTGDWSSLDGQVNPGAINGERIGTPVPDANSYITSAQSTIETATTFEIDKSVVGPDTQFTIGERIDYLIDLKVFEGTLRNVIITDVLVPGLQIDISTLAVVNSGFAGGTVSIRNVQVTTNALGYTILTFELDNDAATAGSQIVNPGDPAGSTAANDTIRIGYQAIVRNVLGNQQGEFLPNIAVARADDVDDAAGVAFVEIVEPHLTVDKRQTSSPTTVDAGDPVDFEVIMTNDGLSTAYDVTLVDTVTPNAVFRAAIAFDSSGNVVGSFTISPNGHVLTGTGFTIAAGDFVRVVYTIVAADTLQPGDPIANGVDVQWTSTPGSNANERTGADGPGPDDTVLNNYVARDAEQVETGRGAGAVTIDKVVFDTSIVETRNTNVAVGEIVTFRLRISLEEGTTVGLHLRDFLPAGQRYIPGTVFVVPGNAGATLNFDPSSVSIGPGNELIIPLGTVVNPGDNLPLNDFVDVFYSVVIVDDPVSVVSGAVLPNTVILTGDRVGATDTAEVTVVEPKLNVDKTVSASFVAIGERASYTITVTHDPTSVIDAFDLVVSDPFDNPNMVLDPASITAVILNGVGLPAPLVEIVGTGFRVTVPDLPVGATLQISFSAIAQNTATVNGQTVVNTATIDYDTVPGTDTPDEQRDYTGSDDATITIAGPDLRVIKDASVLTVEPGELFSYTIQVLNKGAPGLDAGSIEQARNVVLTDTLPRDVILHAVSVDGVPVSFSLDPVNRQFSINLGTMNPDQVHLVTLTVSLQDPLSPIYSGGPDRLLLVNTATATMDQPEPTPLDNTDTAVVIPLVDGRPPTPDLVVTKTNAIEVTGGSETVTFTITAKNVGHRVAAGVEIVDMVDTAVFDFVSASDGGTFDAATGRVIWQFSTLSPDDADRILTLVLKVKPGLPASLDETTNVVVIGDNGLGGRDPTPDNNRDTHTDGLIYPDLVVTKTNNVEEVTPGDIVTYQITVSNQGIFLADGVRVTDLADPRLFRFISASDGGTYDPSTGRVTWNLGTLHAGSVPRVLTLTMEVLFPPSIDIETAVNLVAVTSDGSRGQDADLSNNVDIDVDKLNAAIDPAEIRAILQRDRPFFEEEEDGRLYIAPMLTGRAAAGAYVSVVLIGPDGQRVELGSTQAPASGDWMISLPDMGGRGPLSAIVTTAPPVLTSLGALDANNVFYNPGGDSPIGFQRRYDVFNLNDGDSYTAFQAQIAASEDPLALSSRRFVNFNRVGATGISLY